MAGVNEESHSFTCHPRVYPRMECAIPPLPPEAPSAHHVRALAGTHFPSRWGQGVELTRWQQTGRDSWSLTAANRAFVLCAWCAPARRWFVVVAPTCRRFERRRAACWGSPGRGARADAARGIRSPSCGCATRLHAACRTKNGFDRRLAVHQSEVINWREFPRVPCDFHGNGNVKLTGWLTDWLTYLLIYLLT